MSREQLKELGEGLTRSFYGFLWMVKSKKFDWENEAGLDQILEVG